jgi:predicted O-methyltransferase YrrM
MQLKDAWIFYDLIISHQLHSVLELGFFHGVSTAYLAGAVEDAGGDHVTTIDLTSARERRPNIEQIIGRCGLRDMVEVFYEPRTFNWRLMKFLEEDPPRSYDLIYIDGAHTWVDTGFAFCLSRQLLRPGGWIVFDDIRHTHRTSRNCNQPWVRRMTEEEQTMPQVERVFSLLTMKDTDFDTFRLQGSFGFAHKRPLSMPGSEQDLKIERLIAIAAQRAHLDSEFRQRLLRYPALILADLSGHDEQMFRHVRFVESDSLSPSEPDRSENGLLTHSLERAAWQRNFTRGSVLANS